MDAATDEPAGAGVLEKDVERLRARLAIVTRNAATARFNWHDILGSKPTLTIRPMPCHPLPLLLGQVLFLQRMVVQEAFLTITDFLSVLIHASFASFAG